MDAAKSGVLAGYPVTDIKVILVDGSFHEVDSSEMAFKMAAGIAFNDGLKKANPILLEPIMDMEIVVPEEYMGAGNRRFKFAARKDNFACNTS